jgi:hypothetical protein
MPDNQIIKYYFVDEAGDLTLFDKYKNIVVGQEGSSNCFMVGLADLPNPQTVHSKLEELQSDALIA